MPNALRTSLDSLARSSSRPSSGRSRTSRSRQLAVAVQVVPKVIVITQLADKVVELLGGRGQHLVVHLSAAAADQPSPLDDVARLAAAIARDGAKNSCEALDSFLRTTLGRALRRGHGALIAVTSDKVPDELSDGVPLEEPVDFLGAVEAHAAAPSPETLARIIAYDELLEGVLSTDGITVFSTAGRLLAYNSFVKQRQDVTAPPSTLVGGARRRAHDVLRDLVDRGGLFATFMRSNDGGATFHIGRA